MDKAPSENLADSFPFVLKESGSTSRVDTLSDSISDCLIDVTLPHELIIEILVRLPVKSLLRFKCVSKPWLSLISDPQFIRYHFSKSSSMDEVEDSYVQLLCSTSGGMKQCSLYWADPSAHFSAIEFPPQFHDSIVVGIINGLVCLQSNENDLCVWNPALNKFKHFNFCPEPPSGDSPAQYFYSFGFDESNDDYKVVCFQTGQGNDGDVYVEVRIYSLKADSWRRIDGLKGLYLPDPGVFAYGKIYWSGDLIATPNWKIVSLDMSSDKFEELQQPGYDAGVCSLRMGVSGGRPFVLSDYWKRKKIDLWVLDKHRAEESWCKFVSIPYNYELESFSFDRLLCILRNGEIVFGDDYDLLVYNWKKKEYRNIQLAVDPTEHWTVSAYVESLIWPDYA